MLSSETILDEMYSMIEIEACKTPNFSIKEWAFFISWDVLKILREARVMSQDIILEWALADKTPYKFKLLGCTTFFITDLKGQEIYFGRRKK